MEKLQNDTYFDVKQSDIGTTIKICSCTGIQIKKKLEQYACVHEQQLDKGKTTIGQIYWRDKGKTTIGGYGYCA